MDVLATWRGRSQDSASHFNLHLEAIMQRRFPFRLAAVAVTAMLSTTASARSAGFGGRADASGSGCGSCHGTRSEATSVTLNGPTELAPGATGSYFLTISGEPAVVGGFNVSVSAGTLVPGEGQKLLDGELVQSQSRLAEDGSIRFDFELIAPAEAGALVVRAVGNSANGDEARSDADNWNFAAPLSITVTAPPSDPPDDGGTPGGSLPDTQKPDPLPASAAEKVAEEAVGCSAAGGALGLTGLLLAALAVTGRRRR